MTIYQNQTPATTTKIVTATSATVINKAFLSLQFQIVVTNITVPLLGLVDLALMGHLNDPVFIGAIALASIIFNIIYHGLVFKDGKQWSNCPSIRSKLT